MRRLVSAGVGALVLAVLLAFAPGGAVSEPTQSHPADPRSAGTEEPRTAPATSEAAPREEATLSHTATGTFEVDLKPLPLAAGDAPSGLARMSIDKTFHGDLEGTSRGEMLSARTAVDGSAGYVAIEHVTATLAGRSGTFVLQHSGTMDRGEPGLSVTVVPDSASGGLAGLTGDMDIEVADGKHTYTFLYQLPPAE